MLVRAVRSRQRVPLIRATIVAAFVLLIPNARPGAQQPTAQIPETHTVKRGDTLWDIAKTYLGDPFLWPEIYRLNTDVIEDPHWIYPGEVLKLPGATAKVVAVTVPTAPAPAAAEPRAPASETTIRRSATPPVTTPRPVLKEAPSSNVRVGEYAASPWVDQEGGPRGSGYIIQAGDLPGIASIDRSRMHLYDRVVLAPPVGAAAPERELYLAYKLGPFIYEFGQIVIPTGIIEVTRTPRTGEAAVGRVVKMFGEVLQGHRLIPYDTSAAIVSGTPLAVAPTGAHTGKIRWISAEPVLPSIQSYVVLDISRREGIATGDLVEFYQPRIPPTDLQNLAIPEVWIGRAQVLRVTQYGATAIITEIEQPKIEPGTATRISAKVP